MTAEQMAFLAILLVTVGLLIVVVSGYLEAIKYPGGMMEQCAVGLPLADVHGSPFVAIDPVSRFWTHSPITFALVSDWSPEDLAFLLLMMATWTDGTSIRFEYTKDKARANILIARSDGRWFSFIGTDATTQRRISPARPTLVLPLRFVPTSAQFRAFILHMLGHTLGFTHEHCHPKAGFKSIEKASRYIADQLCVSTASAQRSFLSNHLNSDSVYDPLSIMHLTFPGDLMTDGIGRGQNLSLSDQDKINVADHYYPIH